MHALLGGLVGKGRGRSSSEITKLKSDVRRYKSEIQSLKRQLDSLQRPNAAPLKDPKPPPKHEADCPHCGKGVLKKIDLKFVLLKSCNICQYQERENVKKKTF